MAEGSEEEPQEGSWASFFAKNKKGIAAYLFIEVIPRPRPNPLPLPQADLSAVGLRLGGARQFAVLPLVANSSEDTLIVRCISLYVLWKMTA